MEVSVVDDIHEDSLNSPQAALEKLELEKFVLTYNSKEEQEFLTSVEKEAEDTVFLSI